jgi:hypothetical protein
MRQKKIKTKDVYIDIIKWLLKDDEYNSMHYILILIT